MMTYSSNELTELSFDELKDEILSSQEQPASEEITADELKDEILSSQEQPASEEITADELKSEILSSQEQPASEEITATIVELYETIQEIKRARSENDIKALFVSFYALHPLCEALNVRYHAYVRERLYPFMTEQLPLDVIEGLDKMRHQKEAPLSQPKEVPSSVFDLQRVVAMSSRAFSDEIEGSVHDDLIQPDKKALSEAAALIQEGSKVLLPASLRKGGVVLPMKPEEELSENLTEARRIVAQVSLFDASATHEQRVAAMKFMALGVEGLLDQGYYAYGRNVLTFLKEQQDEAYVATSINNLEDRMKALELLEALPRWPSFVNGGMYEPLKAASLISEEQKEEPPDEEAVEGGDEEVGGNAFQQQRSYVFNPHEIAGMSFEEVKERISSTPRDETIALNEHNFEGAVDRLIFTSKGFEFFERKFGKKGLDVDANAQKLSFFLSPAEGLIKQGYFSYALGVLSFLKDEPGYDKISAIVETLERKVKGEAPLASENVQQAFDFETVAKTSVDDMRDAFAEAAQEAGLFTSDLEKNDKINEAIDKAASSIKAGSMTLVSTERRNKASLVVEKGIITLVSTESARPLSDDERDEWIVWNDKRVDGLRDILDGADNLAKAGLYKHALTALVTVKGEDLSGLFEYTKLSLEDSIKKRKEVYAEAAGVDASEKTLTEAKKLAEIVPAETSKEGQDKKEEGQDKKEEGQDKKKITISDEVGDEEVGGKAFQQQRSYVFNPHEVSVMLDEKIKERISSTPRDKTIPANDDALSKAIHKLAFASNYFRETFNKGDVSPDEGAVVLKPLIGVAEDFVALGYYPYALSVLTFLKDKPGYEQLSSKVEDLEKKINDMKPLSIDWISFEESSAQEDVQQAFDFETVAKTHIEDMRDSFVAGAKNAQLFTLDEQQNSWIKQDLYKAARLIKAGSMTLLPVDKRPQWIFYTGEEAEWGNLSEVYRSGEAPTEKQRVKALQAILNGTDSLAGVGLYKHALAALAAMKAEGLSGLPEGEYKAYFEDAIRQKENEYVAAAGVDASEKTLTEAEKLAEIVPAETSKEGQDKKEGGQDKKEEGQDKKEEGQDKKEEGQDKKEEGQDKKEEGQDKKEE
ncbi:MAG: hypothetical protein PHS57_08900, partial [Alphaproteobacteria bacterium]|nr:hypothetical protein [Alphaproteobacteria bacterium]